MTESPVSSAFGVWPLYISRFFEAVSAGILLIILPICLSDISAIEGVVFASDAFQVGLLFSVFSVALILGQPLAGRLADSALRSQVMAVVSLTAVGVATALMLSITSLWELYLLRALQGFALAFFVPTIIGLVVSRSASNSRGQALGLCGSVKAFGFALGPSLGAVMQQYLSTRSVLLFVAILLFASALSMSQLSLSDKTCARPGDPNGLDLNRTGLLCKGMFSREVLPFVFSAFVASSMATSLIVLQNDFLALDGFTLSGFGIACSAMLFSRMIFDYPIGKASDTLGNELLMILGMATLTVGVFLLVLSPSWEWLAGARAIMGLGIVSFATPCFSYVSSGSSEQTYTQSLSAVTTGFAAGAGIGPLVTGAIAYLFGMYMPLIFWSGLGILATLLMMRHLQGRCLFSDTHRSPEAG